MPPDTWTLPPSDPRCRFAEEMYRTAQAIFLRLGDRTSAAQFQAARDALASYCAAVEKNLHWMHYGLSVGTHVCVTEVYQEACARLCSLASVQPEPTSPLRVITREGIIIDREETTIETSTDETDLGTDDSPFAEGNGR
jgi:hypothetical protein